MAWLGRQLLKVIDWEDDSNDTIVYKYPMDAKTEIMMGSKLTVRESQVAIFINNGKFADIFMPGLYTLDTDNMPVLTSLNSWKYGFKSPFKTDIYFVNTKQFFDQKWGTKNPIMLRDADFGVVRIRGFGAFSYRVGKADTFLKEMFGTTDRFETKNLSTYLATILVSTMTDQIGESKISALDLAANYVEFGEDMKINIKEKFERIGLELCEFIIENLSLPKEVEDAMDKRSTLGVLGDKMGSYMQYQASEAMVEAAKNQGNPFASAGMGMGSGAMLGGMMANAMNPMNANMMNNQGQNNLGQQPQQPQQSKKPCVHCGAMINEGTKFCSECGKTQESKTCPKCNTGVADGVKFCPNCGTSLGEKFCDKCGAKIAPGAKFCPECGDKND